MKKDILDKRSYAIFSRMIVIIAVLLLLIISLIAKNPKPAMQMAFKLSLCAFLMLIGVMFWFRLEYLRDYKQPDYLKKNVILKIATVVFFIAGIFVLFKF